MALPVSRRPSHPGVAAVGKTCLHPPDLPAAGGELFPPPLAGPAAVGEAFPHPLVNREVKLVWARVAPSHRHTVLATSAERDLGSR
jgi:hypothetical protein